MSETEAEGARGIYRIPVVIWLMIYQRLQSKGTLSEAVHFLSRQSVHWKDQPDICKRISLQKISTRTGGYCQARLKLPTLIASLVCDQIFAELQQRMQVRRRIWRVRYSSSTEPRYGWHTSGS